jgi:signal transduction histidine kinase
MRDAVLAGALAVWALVEVAVGVVHGPAVVTVPAALLATLPLAWRRRSPLTAALASAGGLAFETALGIPLSGMAILAAALVASYSVGRHSTPGRAVATLAAMLVLVWLALFGLPERSAGDYAFAALFLAAPGVAGGALRIRIQQVEVYAREAARAEAAREQAARAAVEEERGRIARELHDVLTHTVSVMTIQAGAVRSRLPDELAVEQQALHAVEDAGRQAIGELHRMLGVLRPVAGGQPTAPQPRLADLPELVEASRRSGLPATLRVEGEPQPLDPDLEVSAYRIVQEALTNARKHAGASAVEVCVRYTAAELRLCVADDGRGSASPGLAHGGYGLTGMRERVALYGGTLSLRSAPSAGFVVDAVLPVTSLPVTS